MQYKPKDPVHRSILLGIIEASHSAVIMAKETNTQLAVWIDGKVVLLYPSEISHVI